MKLKDWIAFFFLTFVWGASFFWIKIAVREIDPLTLVAFRLSFGLLGLAFFFPIKKPAIPREGRVWVSLAILGLSSSAIPWVLISWAETRIDSAIASILNGTVPLFTIVVAHLFLRDDRITSDRVLGLLLGFGGVIVLAQRPGSGGGLETARTVTLIGKGAMLLATLSYALGAVHARRSLHGAGALVQAFFSMVFSLVPVLVANFVIHGGPHIPARLDTWVALAWLGILGAGVASFVFYGLLHSVGPTRSSLVTYTLPVVGVTLGVIVLGERLDWRLVAGLCLIVSGVWVVNRR
jgi:drug/metabolite transporter (DMT)-like permease